VANNVYPKIAFVPKIHDPEQQSDLGGSNGTGQTLIAMRQNEKRAAHQQRRDPSRPSGAHEVGNSIHQVPAKEHLLAERGHGPRHRHARSKNQLDEDRWFAGSGQSTKLPANCRDDGCRHLLRSYVQMLDTFALMRF
jgi:hypothetical protein